MTGGERMVFLYLHVSLPLSLSTPVLLLSVLVLLANLSSSFYLFDFCTLNWGSFMYIYHVFIFVFVRCCIIQLYLPLFTLVCTLHRPECDPSDEFPTRGGAGGLTPQSFYTPLSTPLSNDGDGDDDGVVAFHCEG